MSRRAMTVVAAAIVVGAVLLVGVRDAVKEDQAGLTPWGNQT